MNLQNYPTQLAPQIPPSHKKKNMVTIDDFHGGVALFPEGKSQSERLV